MDSLASNEEQPVGGDHAQGEEEEQTAVSNVRAFFEEAEEVSSLLHSIAEPTLASKACRDACERVGEILVQYQEQPGLLDPRIESMVGTLIGAVSKAVRQKPSAPMEVLPNMHLVSSLLYILMTVRGYKTVSRFFPHEAADLEPCLEAAEAEAAIASKDTWSTLYCLTLWLAMVMLTPFDLAIIDSSGGRLAKRILQLGQKGLHSTGRLRDASAWLLAKYFTRPDVSKSGALDAFMHWTRDSWLEGAPVQDSSGIEMPQPTASLQFTRCGIMQAWNQILKAASRSTLRPVWDKLVQLVLHGPSGQGADEDFGASSLLRKLRVAVASRACLVVLSPHLAPWRYERGARSLLLNFAQSQGTEAPRAGEIGEQQQQEEVEEEEVPEEVEEVVELLLTSLSDSDSVVRWAAAKGVGRVTNRLSSDFGDQVVESLEDRAFDGRGTDRAWHGGCLALAELTRRGLLLPNRLEKVVPLVCKALHFEQVSGRQAVGEHVRDAACYVCWAFARAYAPEVLSDHVAALADALLPVAVFDREVNCRRAAAAAVQEHVGRQGTFPHGIEVVTLADFWTLSMRRHAYLEVAPQLAKLGSYRTCLIEHLVLRKLAHQDLHIRVLAAEALMRLAAEGDEETVRDLNKDVIPLLRERAKGAGAGSTAAQGSGLSATSLAARHGAVEGLSALVAALQDKVTPANQDIVRGLVPDLEKERAYRGRGGEVVRQGACHLLEKVALATTWPFKSATCTRYLQTIDECARHTTDAVQVAAIDALRALAKHRLGAEAVAKCAEAYIKGLADANEMIAARRGLVLSLGALPPEALGSGRKAVIEALAAELRGDGLPGGVDQEDPKTRQYAAVSLGCVLLGTDWSKGEVDGEFSIGVQALEVAMADYATDRRGDVGSWVREASMEVIAALLDCQRILASASTGSKRWPQLPSVAKTTQLVALLLQQAVEKIDRLRERAWFLLKYVLHLEPAGDESISTRLTPLELMMSAHQRVCKAVVYSLACTSVQEAAPTGQAWPPAHLEVLQAALRSGPSFAVAEAAGAGVPQEVAAEADASIFEGLVPVMDCEDYRSALLAGLVVSVGGITEHIAKPSRKALLQYLGSQDSAGSDGQAPSASVSSRAEAITSEALQLYERVPAKDNDPEARRLVVPLLSLTELLLRYGCVPEAQAAPMLENVVLKVKSTKDVARLRAAITVLVNLVKWCGPVRRRAVGILLYLLGFTFPVVRQCAAQSLYVRLQEEQGDLDLRGEEGVGSVVPQDVLEQILEELVRTPWSSNNEQFLAERLGEIYRLFGIEHPKGGRSILLPQHAVAAAAAARKPAGKQEAGYADLVREAHGGAVTS